MAAWQDVRMHDPQRDPFYEGLRAGGDLVDLEDVIRELHDENAAIAEI
jgi:hypothetical protein